MVQFETYDYRRMRKIDMRQKLFFICVYFFSVAGIVAQPASFDDVCENFAGHPNMTGNFTQIKTIRAADRSLKSSGLFIFSTEGIVWKTEKPFPSSLAVGKTSVIQTRADGSRSVIDASSNRIFMSIASTLSSLFSGDSAALHENFNVSFSPLPHGWKAELSPKDSVVASVLTSLLLSGKTDGSFAELDSIRMTEASGDTITYVFTEQKYPEELTADEKAFFIAE